MANPQVAAIPIFNINQGGLSDSMYSGMDGSVHEMVGLDLHKEPGINLVHQALVLDSPESGANEVDEFVKAQVDCSDGFTYIFGATTGKVWKRDSAGVYTLLGTLAPSSGSAGVYDAKEYDEYIYYTMIEKVGRWQLGTPFASRNDSWATLPNADPYFHPLQEVNLELYVGDGYQIHQIIGDAFTVEALDLPQYQRVQCLGQNDTDLMIGTYTPNNVAKSTLYVWNTWSVSFTSEHPINEVGINAFLKVDNLILMSAGLAGNLYTIGEMGIPVPARTISGDYSPTKTAFVNANAVANFNGMPLFALSNGEGNPANQGVYSFGKYNENYRNILNLDWPISELNDDDTYKLQDIEIGSIEVVGSIFLVSWWNKSGSGREFGISALDYTTKLPYAFIGTRQIDIDRIELTKFKGGIANYRRLPGSSRIRFGYRKIGEDDYTFHSDDAHKTVANRKQVWAENTIEERALQIGVKLFSDGNLAPELEGFFVKVGT